MQKAYQDPNTHTLNARGTDVLFYAFFVLLSSALCWCNCFSSDVLSKENKKGFMRTLSHSLLLYFDEERRAFLDCERGRTFSKAMTRLKGGDILAKLGRCGTEEHF